MYRTVLALGIGLLAVNAGRADVRPPAGFKSVPLDHKITTEKEYPDYLFFTVTGGKGPKAKLAAVPFDPKTPIVLAGAGRAGIGRQGAVVAVPKDAAKNYDTEEKFHLAIKNRTVGGMIQTKFNLDSRTTVKDTDARTAVVEEFAVEKIDPKGGIVLTRKKSESTPEKKDGEKKDAPDGDDVPTGASTSLPRGGGMMAGLSATLALVLGGLWVVGRGRRVR
jgi:hypothetical protein